jgi:hypothetical protein
MVHLVKTENFCQHINIPKKYCKMTFLEKAKAKTNKEKYNTKDFCIILHKLGSIIDQFYMFVIG